MNCIHRVQKFYILLFNICKCSEEKLVTKIELKLGKNDLANHRFILRRDKNGGVLVIDAIRLLFLNESAYYFAKELIQGTPDEAIIDGAVKLFKTDIDTIRKDYTDFKTRILDYIRHPELYPTDLGFEEVLPFSHEPTAPYRVDLALTYRCNNYCSHCYVSPERRAWPMNKELTTKQWKQVLDKLIEVGVPHVTFTGGEAPLRKDLPELIAYAEELGMYSGLITNGRLLTKELVDKLVKAGLDYIQITLESSDPDIHDKMVGIKGAWEETVQGIKNSQGKGMYILTNTTLTKINMHTATDLVRFLHSIGQRDFAMNGLIYSGSGVEVASKIGIPEDDLDDLILDIQMTAKPLKMRMIWYTPTWYCHFNPLEYGLGTKRCSAAYSSLGIEPNGDVIPCQSYFEPMGNILKDSWESIWYHPLAKWLRAHEWAPKECRECELFKFCGAGCPLYSSLVKPKPQKLILNIQ